MANTHVCGRGAGAREGCVSGCSRLLEKESLPQRRPGRCIAVQTATERRPITLRASQQELASTSGRSEHLELLDPGNSSSLAVPASRPQQVVLKELTLGELEEWCCSIGERPQRAHQLWHFMYGSDLWIRNVDDACGIQDGFSKAFRDKARAAATLSGGLTLQRVHTAADGTRKLVFKTELLGARGRAVEAVLIPVVRAAGTKPRTTLCVSSQVGCAMNCQFCATGRLGLLAHLTTAHIVEQVVEARRYAAAAALEGDTIAPITNIVFMGMGEPLHNLEAVLRAVDIVTHPRGLHFSERKVTVSTVGLVPHMHAFCARSRAQLALSLHATTDAVRDFLAPANRRYPLAELRAALLELFPARPSPGTPHGRHVLIEYVMLAGVNDFPADAERLLTLLVGVAAKINLIAFNAHPGTRFAPSPQAAVDAFRSHLIRGGRVCTVRESRGDDEMAACGQLVGAANLEDRRMPETWPPSWLSGALQPASQ